MMGALEMTRLAALAKTKVKATARGWSMLSRDEIMALAFVTDLILVDVQTIDDRVVPLPDPEPISTL